MRARHLFPILVLLVLTPGLHEVKAEQDYAAEGADRCIDCHDFGDDSPVHPLLAGPHGDAGSEGTPMSGRGCEACHGPSGEHSRSPTQIAPGVSFGPRWSASVAAQNAACVDCHGDDAAGEWQGAHHQRENLSCTTCHDVHTTTDSVLGRMAQTETCTLCHKPQKAGIHGLTAHLDDNPACSSCHAPHDSSGPRAAMLENRSQGCASCHDLVAMADDPGVSAKATSYHKVMAQKDRTCIACHVGVAHDNAAGAAQRVAGARRTGEVTLFFPGRSDSEWLRSQHPGSQPLRQGISCQQCHRGDEAAMGASLADADIDPVTRDVAVAFRREADVLVVELRWAGSPEDRDIALMWGDGGNEVLASAGCFAACHDDMPGMSRDRGQQLDKYLMVSRAQERRIGRPPIVLDNAELASLRSARKHAELWRVTLGQPVRIETGSLLAGIDWHDESLVAGTASFENGRWRVTLRRQLSSLPGGVAFETGREMTLGVALHGRNNIGGRHWVSLPMTFATDGVDTDFRAE